MPVPAAATAAPTVVLAPPSDPPGPTPTRLLPTRRALLGLLVTGGATAGALHLAGSFVDTFTAGPDLIDPASALRLRVAGMTSTVDTSVPAAPHGGHAPAVGTTATTRRGEVWSQLVTVTLVVTNQAATDVLFSPGQVRLRLPDGTGVMPVESERQAGPLRAGSSSTTWVRYLAPLTERELAVDYVPAGAVEPVALSVGAALTRGSR